MNRWGQADRRNIEDILALTPMQQGMLFFHLKDPDSDEYFEQLSLSMNGEIDGDRFRQAWAFVVQTNQALRTVFRWEKMKDPVQVVLKEHVWEPAYADLSAKPAAERRQWLEKTREGDRGKAFDLRRVPFRVTLCRMEREKYEMVVSYHHILLDGWSTGILLREFFVAYGDLSNRENPQKPQKPGYKAYLRWMKNRDREKQEKYWRNYLQGFEAGTGLSIRLRKEKKRGSGTGDGCFKVHLPPGVKDRLEALVRTLKITPAGLFYGAWGVLLQKYGNRRDVVFGTTVSGRSAAVGIKGIENMVGLLINTVPLRVQVDRSARPKVGDFLARLNGELQERETFEAVSPVEIKGYGEWAGGGELFDHILVVENYPLGQALLEGKAKGALSADSYAMFEKTHYPLTVGITLFGEIEVDFGFREDRFDRPAVESLARHYMNILSRMVRFPGKEIGELDILSAEEKDKILADFNRTGVEYPPRQAIHHLFERQVEGRPSRTAVLFGCRQLTYGELNRRSDKIAGLLASRRTTVGGIVGIMAERSLEMLAGILGILKAGGAYLPLEPGCPPDRADYMLADAGAEILLVQAGKTRPPAFAGEILDMGDVGIYRGETSNPGVSSRPQHPAYVIYTSGTTGRPKGVMVEHGSVLNRLCWVKERYLLNEKDVILQATSFVFDVSVCEMFRWIPAGGKLGFLAPGAEKEPAQIVETIARYGATTADFVPTILGLILDQAGRIGGERQDAYGKLASLRWVFTGVETVGVNLVERFNRTLNRFNGTTLVNAYGPTESTVDVTHFDCAALGEGDGDYRAVPIGKPLANVQVYILDRWGGIQPPGVAGEITLAGKGLARGYLNDAELTAEKFVEALSREGRWYRTGDLGRRLEDGHIEFLGRVDRQVKIRGFRVELGEIENHLSNHPHVREAVVLTDEAVDGEKYLCAYIVPTSEGAGDFSPLTRYLRQKLPPHMVPAHWVSLSEIPLNAAGKVDRERLPPPETAAPKGYTAPRSAVEKILADIWSEVLGTDRQRVGLDSHFFEGGGHSLKAMALVSRVHKEWNVRLPLAEVFRSATLRRLAAYIGEAAPQRFSALEVVEEKEYYPLSSAQKRLYVLHQVDETSTRYNMSTAMEIRGVVDKNRLEETFKRLIRRHESLRTSFEMRGNEPVQIIHQDPVFALEYFPPADTAGEGERGKMEKQVIQRFFRGFDLAAAPLLRAGLVETAADRFVLLVDMHHIVSDEASVNLMEREFWALYGGEELPEPGMRYRDFSGWQYRLSDSPRIKKQEEYWLHQYKDGVPTLDFPLDYPRPAVGNHRGSRIGFEIGPEMAARLKRRVLETGTTLFILLLAAYQVLLSKYSGQEDLVVGSPAANRGRPDLENIFGLFVNMLAIRNRPRKEAPFEEFLQEVKARALEAYENQEYPFEQLVWNLDLKLDPGRNPLFDVVFVLRNTAAPGIESHRLQVLPYEIEPEKVHNELILVVADSPDKLRLALDYSTELFKESTAWRIAGHYVEILEQILDRGDIRLEEIRISHDFAAAEADVVQEKESDFRL